MVPSRLGCRPFATALRDNEEAPGNGAGAPFRKGMSCTDERGASHPTAMAKHHDTSPTAGKSPRRPHPHARRGPLFGTRVDLRRRDPSDTAPMGEATADRHSYLDRGGSRARSFAMCIEASRPAHVSRGGFHARYGRATSHRTVRGLRAPADARRDHSPREAVPQLSATMCPMNSDADEGLLPTGDGSLRSVGLSEVPLIGSVTAKRQWDEAVGAAVGASEQYPEHGVSSIRTSRLSARRPSV
jgi:hypothetical protein